VSDVSAIRQLTETLAGFDERYTARLRHALTARDWEQAGRLVEDQQRETHSALARLNEALARRAPTGSSGSLPALEKAVRGWPHYCLVRYHFRGGTVDLEPVLEALPSRLGKRSHAVVTQAGVLLAAVESQLLDYAAQAEGMEQALGQLAGAVCASRVVEPRPGETMRQALARLEKAG